MCFAPPTLRRESVLSPVQSAPEDVAVRMSLRGCQRNKASLRIKINPHSPREIIFFIGVGTDLHTGSTSAAVNAVPNTGERARYGFQSLPDSAPVPCSPQPDI